MNEKFVLVVQGESIYYNNLKKALLRRDQERDKGNDAHVYHSKDRSDRDTL